MHVFLRRHVRSVDMGFFPALTSFVAFFSMYSTKNFTTDGLSAALLDINVNHAKAFLFLFFPDANVCIVAPDHLTFPPGQAGRISDRRAADIISDRHLQRSSYNLNSKAEEGFHPYPNISSTLTIMTFFLLL